MSAEPVIDVDNLRVAYGALEAVRGVSLRVGAGTVFGLVGPNGAGKTSTLKVLAGLLRPSGGAARVCGFDVLAERDDVRRSIGYMADFFGVYDYLTVREYLAFFGGMYGLRGADLAGKVEAAIASVALAGKRDALIHTLSRGMKQRLYLARAWVHRPRVLILDEPASGMDPRGRNEMVDALRRTAADGVTVLISSHILDELEHVCSMVGVMEAGRLVGVHEMRPEEAHGAGARRLLLLSPRADRDRALALAPTLPGVRGAGPAEDGLWLDVSGGDDAVAEVVRRMVEHDVRVLLPAAGGARLKQVFLHMTKGELT